MNASSIQSHFIAVATLLPMVLVWLGGAIAAIVNWQRAPTSSLLVLLAMADLAFFNVLGRLSTSVLAPMLRGDAGMTTQQVAALMSATSLIIMLGIAVGLVLLLVAVYVGRPNPHRPPWGQLPKG